MPVFNTFKRCVYAVCYIYNRLFASPQKYAKFIGVNIGDNNLIGKKHWSSEPYLITIGSCCQLTNCKIFTHGGAQVVRHICPTFDFFGKVNIGNCVYVGHGSLIMPGVTIGDHALIAAGSIVTKSVPPNAIVAGNPARIIGNIDDFFVKNQRYNINSKMLSYTKKRKLLLQLPEDKFVKK